MEEQQKVDALMKAIKQIEETKMDDTIQNIPKSKVEKMEVDTETTKNENENTKPLVLKLEPISDDLVQLKIEGIDTTGDENEEMVIMTSEEIRAFLKEKITGFMKDPEVNPLLGAQVQSQSLVDEISDKHEEINRLAKALDVMYRNHEKFLRQMNIFPKVQTNSVSVSVDLPLLLDSVPLMSSKGDEEDVIKNDLPEAKVLHPTVSKTKSATPTIPNSSFPNFPSDISITPATPNTSLTSPVAPKASPSAAAPKASPAAAAAPKASPAPAAAAPKASASAPVSNLISTMKSLPNLAPKPTDDIECIDLTDDAPATPVNPVVNRPVTNHSPFSALTLVKHPAPLPPKPFSAPNRNLPNVPPKPRLKISSEERGIVLQWDMPPCYSTVTSYSKLKCFDIFGYQEQKNVVINTLLWKKIGAVQAMTLPMACTLTQFLEGQKYHFAIRAVDIYDRCGSYSDPISIVYKPHKKV